MVADTLPASTYTSSLGAGTLTLPLLAPAAIVIVAPLLSVTVTGALRGAGQRRGVDDAAALGHARRGARLTVVVFTVSVTPWWPAAGLTARFSKLPPRRC